MNRVLVIVCARMLEGEDGSGAVLCHEPAGD